MEQEHNAIEELKKRDFIEELKSIFAPIWVKTLIVFVLSTVAIAILGLIVTNYVINFIHIPR